jgi:NADH dehydrogenase
VPDHDARGGTLILGGGFAGSYVARYLGKRGATIVSPDNYMPYTLMLPEAALLVDAAGLPVEERGRVPVDSTLRVSPMNRIWALGDCAAVPNLATPGRLDPPTCQHALRQARRLAKNLKGDARRYRYRMLGEVATLGRYKGIANVLGIRFRGFPGWWITRTYHLYQLPLSSRKLRVVADWTVALFFRRGIGQLGTLGHPERVGDG